MGPPTKGKKAWRKNIDASELDTFHEEATHQERRGPAVETLTDSDLFFVDKASDQDGAKALASGKRRGKQQGKQLMLRSQVILEQAHKAKPVLQHKQTVRKVQPLKKADKGDDVQTKRAPKFSSVPAGQLDIWGQDSLVPSTSGVPDEPPLRLKPKFTKPVLKRLPIRVKAVEIDMAGCSYNPEPEAHQDALAVMVASEMKRMLQKELAPVAPPKMVDMLPGADGDELEQLQVEEEPDEDENEIRLGDDDEVATKGKSEKKTQKDRNREKRRQSQEKENEERLVLKKHRRDLENLGQIEQEMEEQHKQRELKRQRRQVVKDEKAASLPGRLGRHKFEPAGLQVATSDELSGSLRQVKACPMVTLHRFKSLQHRGLIEPRKAVLQRAGKRIEYEKGLRTEKAMAAQTEIEEMRKQRKVATKQAKKAKTAGDA